VCVCVCNAIVKYAEIYMQVRAAYTHAHTPVRKGSPTPPTEGTNNLP